jgi:hypothetical protein
VPEESKKRRSRKSARLRGFARGWGDISHSHSRRLSLPTTRVDQRPLSGAAGTLQREVLLSRGCRYETHIHHVQGAKHPLKWGGALVEPVRDLLFLGKSKPNIHCNEENSKSPETTPAQCFPNKVENNWSYSDPSPSEPAEATSGSAARRVWSQSLQGPFDDLLGHDNELHAITAS